jgi:hypothetical protein
LVTKEFFEALREHMTPGAVLSVNIAWWDPRDEELLHRVAATVRTAFPSVYALTGISPQSGAVLLAGGTDAAASHVVANAEAVGHPELIEIARETVGENGNSLKLTRTDGVGAPLTDDRAPIGAIADRLYRKTREEQHRRERNSLPQ